MNVAATAVDPLLETTQVLPSYKLDLRTASPDTFVDETVADWRSLTWNRIGRPYRVKNISRLRKEWEYVHETKMPVSVQWHYFNRSFHEFFIADVPEERAYARRRFLKYLRAVDIGNMRLMFKEWLYLTVWNRAHRLEDFIWDSRGKRALFAGLDVQKPRILCLGAADGYDAMQLQAMYPGGDIVIVDFDEFCKTDRFGHFPEEYPFLGKSSITNHWEVYHKSDFNIDYLVMDIRDLWHSREFDIVMSNGLIDHFSDDKKPELLSWHRKFLKPDGYAIITSTRRQRQTKLFYRVMGEIVNFSYRELMDARQLGRYVYENGFDILRCGHIKGHNGVIAKIR